MRTLLIDGDIVVYQIASAVETGIDWGEGMFTLHADLTEAQGRAADYVETLRETLDADKVVIALKDSENWRKKILPTYKAHREGTRAPMVRVALHEWMKTKWQCFQKPTLEGDDVIGILATHPKLIKGEKVIVSIDKDMKTIPSLIYNPRKPDDGIVEIAPAEADYWHMKQTLMGDATDGYSGCPGIGPKKADAILDPVKVARDNCGSMWAAVVTAYIRAGLSPELALTMARVARICRYTDYDFKKKEVILWSPEKK